MQFRYDVERDSDGSYLVSFKDVPEAITVVYDEKEIEQRALEALVLAFDFYIEDNREIPQYTGQSNSVIYLPTATALKVLLHNEFVKSNLKKADIAKKANVAPSNLERVFNFHYKSKIEAIEKVLNCLGRRVDVALIGG